MKPKMKSTACALLVALSMLSGPTGCASASRDAADMRRLYQPPVLRLSPGQIVPTADGIHQAQTAEVWHSDARYRALEKAYLDQLATR
jgi:hypothetical protein